MGRLGNRPLRTSPDRKSFICTAVGLLCVLGFVFSIWTGAGDVQINGSDLSLMDEEWFARLRSESFTSVRKIFGQKNAHSRKARLFFGEESAIMKMITRPESEEAPLILLRYDENKHTNFEVGVSGIAYQGWAEIAAFHVDRVIGFNRKPTTAGRIVTVQEMDELGPAIRRTIFRLDGKQQSTRISLQAWIHGIYNKQPSFEHLAMLTMRKKVPDNLDQGEMEELRSISDVFVFDYLVDDHDREARKNWMRDKDDRLLLLDSGLAWKHGPGLVEDCFDDIMCDPSEYWQEREGGHHGNRGGRREKRKTIDDDGNTVLTTVVGECPLVCRFRAHTIIRLRGLGPDAYEEQKLGALVRKSLESDVLSPVVHLGRYKNADKEQERRFAFGSSDFFRGLDDRVARLLKHVDKCIAQHGVGNVLL